jgi:signal transduction histidine kinase
MIASNENNDMTRAQERQVSRIKDNEKNWRIWLARSGWLLLFLLITAIFIASAPSAMMAERKGWLFGEAVQVVWPHMSTLTFAAIVVAARMAALAVFYAVTLLIAFRKWDDWFALFVSASLLMTAYGFVARGDTTSYMFPGWFDSFAAVLSRLFQGLFLLCWLLLFYLLPDGHFVPRRSAWFILLAITSALPLLAPDLLRSVIPPSHWEMAGNLAWSLFSISFLFAIAAGLISQVLRYRNVATPTQRQQMKWILFGLALQPLPILLGLGGITDSSPWSAVFNIFFQLAIATILPVTIGLAILRRRLWDVDPIINRTLVYGGLTLLIVGLYVAFVGLAFLLLGETPNVYLAALATGIVALLAQPIRIRLQRGVNRLMYGDRDDPATVLTRLNDRLASAVTPGETLPLMVETIAQTLKLPYVAIEGTTDAGQRLVTAAGRPTSIPERLPLVYESTPVGYLLVSPRSPEETFTPDERRLLESIAHQSGPVLYAAQLTDHLQHSREQLVLAREEERRRLQRDLHDGLGPQLATMSTQLDVARNLAMTSSPALVPLLTKLSTETRLAISDIRRLVYDLRPPALDQLGLIPALREFVSGQNGSSGLRIDIDAPANLPPLPAAVEVAAYRIVQEATTNCSRHAGATECRIKLEIGEVFFVEIGDNGQGMTATAGSGVGLASMRERAVELGGEFQVDSQPGFGTRVRAWFPLAKDTRS